MKPGSGFCSVLILLICLSGAGAVTVDKLTLVERRPGLFVETVRASVNTKTKATLVVYEVSNGTRSQHSLWGRLLSADGAPAGASFQILNSPKPQFHDVAYNQDANEFVLVFSSEVAGAGRFQVFSQRLSAAGRRLGKAVRVSPAADAGMNITNLNPRVYYDGRTTGYVVIFLRYAFSGATTASQGLVGCVLNPNLAIRTPLVVMSPLVGDSARIRGPYVQDLGFQASSGKLLLSGYYDSSEAASSWQYFVSKADATLQKPQITLTSLKPGLSSGAAPYASLAFLPGGGVSALFVEGTGVKKRRLNPLGAPVGAVSLFFTGAVQTVPLEFPSAALAVSNNLAETAVVAVDDSSAGTGKLWLQNASGTGAASGQPSEIQSNLSIGRTPVITPLPVQAQGGFQYAVVFVDGVRLAFPPGPSESTGLVLLKVTTAP